MSDPALPPSDPDPDLNAPKAPPAQPPSPGFLRRNRRRMLQGGVVFIACSVARFLWWFFIQREARWRDG
jgi:hypothetical protein